METLSDGKPAPACYFFQSLSLSTSAILSSAILSAHTPHIRMGGREKEAFTGR